MVYIRELINDWLISIKETIREALFDIMIKSQENMYKQQGKWEKQKAKQDAIMKELKEKYNIQLND